MSNEIPKITVVTGDNQFEMRNAKAKFVERAEKLFPNHISEYFDGTGEISFGKFISGIQTPSMFGDVRIFFINHAENKNNLAGKSNFEAFKNAMKLCVENVFIFVEINDSGDEKTNKNAFPAKELAINLRTVTEKFGGNFLEFKAMREYEIPKWIVEKTNEYFGRRITEQNAELLVKFSGADLGVLDGELRKIDAALPKRKEITQEDICELTGNNKNISSFEIVEFIGLRKWDNATLAAFENFSSKDNSFAIPFLSDLYRKFWSLLKIRTFAEENRAKANAALKGDNNAAFDIGVACGIMKQTHNPKAVYPIMVKPKIIQQATFYTINEIFDSINLIAQLDRDIKNGVIKSDDNFRSEVKELCRKIVRMGK